jgi:tetratricopeptide (TPR) repeat protein
VTNQIREQLQGTLGAAYTLERELGGGGMSRVFVAEENRLKRKVVIKVLSPELAQGISVDRFEREIQTAAALQQANIVPVLSAGDTNGLPFYTMPFVEGESLRARLARGPLSVSEVVSILRDVSRALAYAHARGVVHRDIKPDNVLLSGGAAVVTDFGIAKAISASRTQSGGATLTQIGTSIGTPAYMAPEQAAGDPDIDHRADLYALGAMAYELLSGQAVFASRTPQRMLAAHMSETPKPVSDLRPDTPTSLADLVMKCLAKEPSQRPQQATEIVRALETTSGGSMAAMPPILLGGPGMFRKALGIYAVAFGAVAILAKAAIVGIGLPDWVFPGSLVVMALGLPVILWTGYVQRVTRRAMAATPTFTPGGTPAMKLQGTMATMALKAAPHVSWYRTARGGMYALGVFVAMIVAFMGMRAFGIGPFGSLVATGAFKERDRVIIADFSVANADSSLGRVVGDAIRAGLGDSRVFTLVTPAEMGGALQRMQLPPTSHVNLATARQMALREGVKAIIDGDVTMVGTSYIVAVRLVTADSARELASFRGTAKGSDDIITVADDLSRKLRAKAGESLRRVQATPALAYASTSSLEALRKYSDAARANDIERDFPRAVRLLREAVSLDSNFAEGWRKLAVAMRNGGGFPPSASDSAIQRAYNLRDRMTERERDAVLAYYYQGSPGYDRSKAIATYERMLARGDSSVALQNLAVALGTRQQFARAESLYRTQLVREPNSQNATNNLLSVLANQGKWRDRDSLIAVSRKRFGNVLWIRANDVGNMVDSNRIADAFRMLDSARKAGDQRDPSWAPGFLAGGYELTGQFRQSEAMRDQVRAINVTRGRAAPLAFFVGGRINGRLEAGLPYAPLISAFEAAIDSMKVETLPLTDRPYLYFAEMYAKMDRADKARAWLAKYESTVKDTALRRWNQPDYQHTVSHVLAAEKKWQDAARQVRLMASRPDGPTNSCAECVHTEALDLFLRAGMADSALASYNAYLRTPVGSRPRSGPNYDLGAPVTEALAKIYDTKGDVKNAAKLYGEFVEIWKDADPELQPRVKAARERLAQLTPVEKTRR